MPLTQLLPVPTNNYFGNRLDNLADALQKARHATADSRKYNPEQLARRANAGTINIGDTVVVKAEERLTLTSRWDTQYEVMRVCGPVMWLRQQTTGKTRKLRRSYVKIVDPKIAWDDITPRPKRDQCKRDPLRQVRFAPSPALDPVPEENSDENGIIETTHPTRVTDSQVETVMDATIPNSSAFLPWNRGPPIWTE